MPCAHIGPTFHRVCLACYVAPPGSREPSEASSKDARVSRALELDPTHDARLSSPPAAQQQGLAPHRHGSLPPCGGSPALSENAGNTVAPRERLKFESLMPQGIPRSPEDAKVVAREKKHVSVKNGRLFHRATDFSTVLSTTLYTVRVAYRPVDTPSWAYRWVRRFSDMCGNSSR